MQSVVLVNNRWRNFPSANYFFEDSIFHSTSGTFVDTGVAIIPDSGINLVIARANCSAGGEGTDAGRMQVIYAETSISIAEGYEATQGDHWKANDMGMMKLIDSSGTGELKLQARTGAPSGRSIDMGSQQVLSIPLETMGLVEGVDYWQGEFHEGTGPGDPFKWDTGIAWDGSDTLNGMVSIARLDWTAPETELYYCFYSWESAMINPVGSPGDNTMAVYPIATDAENGKKSCSITSSGTIATVTDVAHGFLDDFTVVIEGANQSEYNGSFVIDKLTADTYRYTMAGDPSSPATGSITHKPDVESSPTNVNHVAHQSTFPIAYFQSQCWITVRTMTAGEATAALVGRVWQKTISEVQVRRVRMIVIKASSLVSGDGWGDGGQQTAKHFNVAGEWDPRVGQEGNGDTFAEVIPYTQTYTPPGPAAEQTIFFGMFINNADGHPPNRQVSFKLRNITDGKDFAIDMCPILPEDANVHWTFGMGVRDNNTTSSTWQAQARDANNVNLAMIHRRGYVIVAGLKGNN